MTERVIVKRFTEETEKLKTKYTRPTKYTIRGINSRNYTGVLALGIQTDFAIKAKDYSFPTSSSTEEIFKQTVEKHMFFKSFKLLRTKALDLSPSFRKTFSFLVLLK